MISACLEQQGSALARLHNNEYVFFDALHPAESAAKHFAKLMWRGNRDVIESYNLKHLFHDA
ncbi:GDSL esterase/lipase 5-like [Sesbania bispinosa]|nr:GDSL esterase/lipase 5-like [Sesbania bispinosa]